MMGMMLEKRQQRIERKGRREEDIEIDRGGENNMMELRWREEGSSSGREIDLQCDSTKMDHYTRRKLMELKIFSASKRRKMIC